MNNNDDQQSPLSADKHGIENNKSEPSLSVSDSLDDDVHGNIGSDRVKMSASAERVNDTYTQKRQQPSPVRADAQHITIESSAFQSIDSTLKDLVKETRKTRRRGWLGKLVWFVLFLGVIGYLFSAQNKMKGMVQEHTALVNLHGVISAQTEANSVNVNAALRNAFENQYSRGVILHIDSPGGSPVQSQEIYDHIRQLVQQYPDKPFFAVIGDIGASGGYYVAAASNTVYASPASIVGSIGVRMDSFGLTGLMDKMGVERRLYTAGDNKAVLDPFSPVNPNEVTHIESLLAGVHQQFINAVLATREGKIDVNDEDLFSGLIWNGEQANENGLIDGFRSVDQVAREEIKHEMIVDYTVRPDYLSLFAKNVGVSVANQMTLLLNTMQIK